MASVKRVAVIGAGAAGCFCAVEIKRRLPEAEVVIYEAASRPLVKVGLSGGGRCNFTNTFEGVDSLQEVYPRGAALMKRLLHGFSAEDTRAWFEREGVPSVAEDDGRVFPSSQNSADIVDTLLGLMRKLGVILVCGRHIKSLDEIEADAIVLTTGGKQSSKEDESPRKDFLLDGIRTVPCVPSLFSFRINDHSLRELTGISVKNAGAAIAGTKFRCSGDILITDWGLSGPAILKLSSHAAVLLSQQNYRADLIVDWSGWNEEQAHQWMSVTAEANPKKKVSSVSPEGIPSRLWKYMLVKSGINEGKLWSELGAKRSNRLVSVLTADSYRIAGRNTWKSEFVTCGGVDLSGINPATMESKTREGLFFAGEILDVDAVTGGFNLQAAWSTAMAAAKGICERL